tara:strand:+ start:373 stop:774 length:402 start_codon:yes stop_codon:yes gene_type:complete
MKLVIDTNVIISMLIRPGKSLDLFFNDGLEIYAPKLLLEELENNMVTIVEKSLVSVGDIERLLEILKDRIKFVDEKKFLKYREEAIKLCPHEKDVVYFALALYLKCAIWSQEKGFKNQDKIKVYDIQELIRLI